MEPVNRLFACLKACPSLVIHVSGRMLRPFFRSDLLVLLSPPKADDKYISNFDVPSLGLGSDVNSLIFGAGCDLFERNSVPFKAVVPFSLLLRIARIVEKNAPTTDAMLREVMN